MKLKRATYILLAVSTLNLSADLLGAVRRVPFSRSRNQFFFNSVPTNSAFRNLSFSRFGNRFDLLTGNSSFFNANNLVDQRLAKQVDGFSKIKQLGNNLIEVDQFGIGQRLFIGRNGELIGGAKPPEARTVQQLKEFYLLNRDKFQGNAKNLVDRFLGAQGALSNGQFLVDIDDFPIDTNNALIKDILAKRFNGDERAMRRELGLAALNYLLNTLQARFKIKIPREKVRADGTVALNLAPFFRGEALALFQTADPTSACTGKTRLSKLIDFTMDPGNYYKILNAPKTIKEVAQAYGVEDDKTLSIQNKIIIGTNKDGVPESIPASTSEQRVLEVQTARNIGSLDGASRPCYRSLDIKDKVAQGEQSRSRSIKSEGINFAHDAEEWLCLGGNGFMQGYLFNGQGQLLERAPAEIAADRTGILGPSIKATVSCLDCHADGFIGGGEINKQGGKFYTDHFNDVPDRPTGFVASNGQRLNHRDFFTSNGNYVRRTEQDSLTFRRARQETGSEFLDANGKPFKTLPSMVGWFQKQVTPENAAVELGLGSSPGAVQQARSLIGERMSRTDFEGQFCNLSRGRVSVLDERDEQSLLRQQQINNGIGIQNHIR